MASVVPVTSFNLVASFTLTITHKPAVKAAAVAPPVFQFLTVAVNLLPPAHTAVLVSKLLT